MCRYRVSVQIADIIRDLSNVALSNFGTDNACAIKITRAIKAHAMLNLKLHTRLIDRKLFTARNAIKQKFTRKKLEKML